MPKLSSPAAIRRLISLFKVLPSTGWWLWPVCHCIVRPAGRDTVDYHPLIVEPCQSTKVVQSTQPRGALASHRTPQPGGHPAIASWPSTSCFARSFAASSFAQ
jgi:hypothetical protein